MKILTLLIILSSNIFANPLAMITNLEGDVKVNKLEVSEKTEIKEGYKVSVNNGNDNFAVITFSNGQRFLLLSGEVIFEKLSLELTRMVLKNGEVYLHVISNDSQYLKPIVQVKTNVSNFNIHGGDAYFNKVNDKLFFGMMSGFTKYSDAWGKVNVKKSESLKLLSENKAPKVEPIPYKIWRRIKVGFERMGIKI
jgi:hypothetical protein